MAFENYLPVADSGTGSGQLTPRSIRRGIRRRLDKASLAAVGGAYLDLIKSPSLQNVTKRPGEVDALYFCVPPNDKLLSKWDLVADRLFKIRHCRNIEGQALQLPLLAPPIDPAVLVRAKAMGVDIETVLDQLDRPLPHYRFQVLAQKATELCGEVKSLGGALLLALEKRDGEALALLRNSHENQLLEAVRAIKEHQVAETELTLEGMERSRDATTLRRDYYQQQVNEFMNPEEIAHGGLMAVSLILQAYQAGMKWGSVATSLIPNIKGGFVTTLGVTYGGNNTGDAVSRASDAIGSIASTLSSLGGLISTMGSYRRRAQDWQLQVDQANKELEGLEKQIAAAQVRVAIAASDLANQKLQMNQNREILEFMQQKYTNRELYDWMVSQTAALYFQTYQLAFDMARKAERAFAYELGSENPGIIKYGYWDNLKKGLLAGDRLHHDVKRLEVAFLDRNAREYELTKHISLSMVDPMELIRLRETGMATFGLPEALFDMDFPGHYMRRIKSVSLSIPCVTGPFSGVNATIRLLQSRTRLQPDLPGGAYPPVGDEDPRFTAHHAGTRAVATSTGQNDSGLFELNFRDERYLPFEGEGVESLWSLSMNKNVAQFDFDTISDVVLHIRYTAREGGEALRIAALDSLANLQEILTTLDGEPQPLTRLFSVRHDFPDAWARFQGQPIDAGERHALTLDFRPEHYPFWSQGRLNHVDGIMLFARGTQTALPIFGSQDANDSDTSATLTSDPALGNLLAGDLTDAALPDRPDGEVTLFFEDPDMTDLWVTVIWRE